MSKKDFYKLFDFSEQECEDKEFWDKLKNVVDKHTKEENDPPKKWFTTALDSDDDTIDIAGNVSYMEGVSYCIASAVELIAQAFGCDKETIDHVSEAICCCVRESSHILASAIGVDYQKVMGNHMNDGDYDE